MKKNQKKQIPQEVIERGLIDSNGHVRKVAMKVYQENGI